MREDQSIVGVLLMGRALRGRVEYIVKVRCIRQVNHIDL